MNKGGLIFTTKDGYTSVNFIAPLILYIIGCASLFIMFPGILDTIIGYVIALGFLLAYIYPFVKATQLKKSYIELYDDCIIGFSIPKSVFSMSNNSGSTFHLNYSDVTHISSQKNIVEIHYAGGSYLVQAKDCEQKIIDLINQQIITIRQHDET